MSGAEQAMEVGLGTATMNQNSIVHALAGNGELGTGLAGWCYDKNNLG